jgi:hypothetical protein
LNVTANSNAGASTSGDTTGSNQPKPVSRNKGLSAANSKVDAIADEFKNFYVFPHEYLCLVCNAKDRVDMLESAFQISFALEKETVKNDLQPMRN